jgi:hypothetical protein
LPSRRWPRLAPGITGGTGCGSHGCLPDRRRPSGWKCAKAQRTVGIEQYEHDPKDEHWGFTSWNDFFTRRFKDGERPVASPDDDKVIVSACESTPYGISTDVKRQDRFGSRTSLIR